MIKLITQPAPTIPDSIAKDLVTNRPNVLLCWNSRKYENINGSFNPRWEIWIRLVSNTHSLNRFKISKKDLFQDGSIYRLLQTWCFMDDLSHKDIGYCGIDSRIMNSFFLADTFRNRTFYEDVFENFVEEKDRRESRDIRNLASGATQEYYKLDNPRVGRYTKGNWRHQIR